MCNLSDILYASVLQSKGAGISRDKLKDRYTYGIASRSSHIGVWHKKEEVFIVYRWGYGGSLTLMFEEHWDEPPVQIEKSFGRSKEWHTGTVKPLLEIEKCPISFFDIEEIESKEEEIIDYLRRLALLFFANKMFDNYLKFNEEPIENLKSIKSEAALVREMECEARRIRDYWELMRNRSLQQPIHLKLGRDKYAESTWF